MKSQDTFNQIRQQMVKQQLVARGISDQNVLFAMGQIPREKFVPPEIQKYAYQDGPLTIGRGQTISQPYIVAYMTEHLNPHEQDKILEVGTGSGYQAAVLAEIVDQVYTIEIQESLFEKSKYLLEDVLGYSNIITRLGNGRSGWPEEAPFDKIIVTAGSSDVPQNLVDQLKPGGRLIIPIGDNYGQHLLLIIKDNTGQIKEHNLLPVAFVPLK